MSDNVKLSMTGEALLDATEQSVSLVREDGEFVLRVAEGQLAERALTRTVKARRLRPGVWNGCLSSDARRRSLRLGKVRCW